MDTAESPTTTTEPPITEIEEGESMNTTESTISKEINIEDLWFTHEIITPTTPKIAKINIPFILRFLFFCDQCHDFCENTKRNKWSTSGGGSQNTITNLFKLLKSEFDKDLNWLQDQFSNPNFTEFKSKLIINEAQAKDTKELTKIIDNILEEYLDIKAIKVSDFLLDEQQKRKSNICSGASNILLKVKDAMILENIEDKNKYNITVDADKSKINLGSFLLMLCDQLAINNSTKINFYNTIATKYDAASGSGTKSYLDSINKSLEILTSNNEHGKYEVVDNIEDLNIIIKYNNIPLINFTYRNQDDKVILTISQFFSNDWNLYPAALTEDINSVSAITTTNNVYAETYVTPSVPTNPSVVPAVPYTDATPSVPTASASIISSAVQGSLNIQTYKQILCKTLSDFGQVAVFNIYSEEKKRNIFITFDKICSRIACLFLPYTIFENLNPDIAIAPITVFILKKNFELLKDTVESLLKLNDSENQRTQELTSAARILLQMRGEKSINRLKRQKTASFFGKKNKIKHQDKVIKLAKKYRIKFDKNTIKNLKNLYNVQKIAKKYNIKITKKTSKGKRIYKSEKELIKNIKEFNKSHNNKTLKKVKLLREKAKKYNIKITKKTSKGKRIYKTNKELEKELKKFKK